MGVSIILNADGDAVTPLMRASAWARHTTAKLPGRARDDLRADAVKTGSAR